MNFVFLKKMAKKVNIIGGIEDNVIIEVVRICKKTQKPLKKIMTFGEWKALKKSVGFFYVPYQKDFSQFKE